MTRFDLNGNTVPRKRSTLVTTVYSKNNGTYETDSAGRVMVNLEDGGHISFFADEETALTAWVTGRLKKK